MMAGCGFANATGLPITLLTAFAGSDEQKLRNYLLLVSIYQVLFPMINWTVGRKLLSKPEEDEDELRSGIHRGPSGMHTNLAQHQQEVPELPDKVVQRPKETWGQFARGLVSSALVPPVIAILSAFTICMLHVHGHPFIKDLFVDTNDFTNDHALEWAFDAILCLGKAAVPLNMLVLGSGLGNIPNFSSIPWPSTIALVFAKLVVHPAMGFGLVFLAVRSGFIAEIPDQLHAKDDLVLVALIMCSCPTSPSLALMAELYGGPENKNFLSGAIFLMYCCAPVVLTAWLVLFVSFSEMVPS
jgi:predicted permease